MEKAASAEMEQTSTVIKKTGIFDRVDTLYGEFGTTPSDEGEAAAEGGDEFGGGESFGGGGGGFGDDFGAEMEGAATTEAGAEEGGEIAAAETPVESTNKKGDLLTEENKKNIENKVKKYRNIFHKKLLDSINNDEKIYNVDDLDEEVHTQNVKIDQMTKEIDEIIK